MEKLGAWLILSALFAIVAIAIVLYRLHVRQCDNGIAQIREIEKLEIKELINDLNKRNY